MVASLSRTLVGERLVSLRLVSLRLVSLRLVSLRLVNLRLMSLMGLLVLGAGCKDLTGNSSLPAGTNDPAFYNTPSGAQGLYQSAVYVFQTSLLPVIVESGLLTDELEDTQVGTSRGVLQASSVVIDPLDERILPEGSSAAAEAYGDLQAVRNYAGQARAALLAYDTVATDTANVRTYRGILALFTGYAELWLADFYCSGVPLSTVDFHKDFTYAASSTTTQVYRAALAQLDTALALTRDSAELQKTASVARGRVFLALGQYDSAAAAVRDIPTAFQYQRAMHGAGDVYQFNFILASGTVSDREGGNGLPYVSSGDPRTAVTVAGVSSTNAPLRYPTKYTANAGGIGFLPFTLADGIEARLIEAEVALQTHGATSADTTWLHILNDLRATAAIPGNTHPDPGALPPLHDPGVTNGGRDRIALVFAERAAWLFLTGHRQGDLRRLLRQYHWLQSQVYPTGEYTAPGTGFYGADVTMPIPAAESENPNFHGCLDRDA